MARHFAPSTDEPRQEAPVDEAPATSRSARHAAHAKARPAAVATDDNAVYGVGVDKGRLGHATDGRSGRRLPLLGILLSVLFLLACFVIVATMYVSRSISMGSEGDDLRATLSAQEADASLEDSDNEGFYVLLVGSDAREGDETSRGDVLMLMRIDASKGIITLVSIPRDTMVNIQGALGVQKINATYAYGGSSTAVYEISKFAGVPISHYIEIDFSGLEQLVDLLGGIWVDVPETVSLYQDGSATLEAGMQLLDGKTALAYARERYSATGGDFGRARAQRLIVQALVTQIVRADPSDIPGLVKSLTSCVSTDYTAGGLASLALRLQGEQLTIYSCVCPSYALWQDGVAYVGTMFDEWCAMMKRVDAGLDPNDTSVEIPEPQASSTKLGAASNSEAPKDYHGLAESAMTTDSVEEAEPVVVE